MDSYHNDATEEVPPREQTTRIQTMQSKTSKAIVQRSTKEQTAAHGAACEAATAGHPAQQASAISHAICATDQEPNVLETTATYRGTITMRVREYA